MTYLKALIQRNWDVFVGLTMERALHRFDLDLLYRLVGEFITVLDDLKGHVKLRQSINIGSFREMCSRTVALCKQRWKSATWPITGVYYDEMRSSISALLGQAQILLSVYQESPMVSGISGGGARISSPFLGPLGLSASGASSSAYSTPKSQPLSKKAQLSLNVVPKVLSKHFGGGEDTAGTHTFDESVPASVAAGPKVLSKQFGGGEDTAGTHTFDESVPASAAAGNRDHDDSVDDDSLLMVAANIEDCSQDGSVAVGVTGCGNEYSNVQEVVENIGSQVNDMIDKVMEHHGVLNADQEYTSVRAQPPISVDDGDGNGNCGNDDLDVEDNSDNGGGADEPESNPANSGFILQEAEEAIDDEEGSDDDDDDGFICADDEVEFESGCTDSNDNIALETFAGFSPPTGTEADSDIDSRAGDGSTRKRPAGKRKDKRIKRKRVVLGSESDN